jgi:hypothetical protein
MASCASASLVPAGNSNISLASKGFATRSGSSTCTLRIDDNSGCAVDLELAARGASADPTALYRE